MLKSILHFSSLLYPKLYNISVNMVYITSEDPNYVVIYHLYALCLRISVVNLLINILWWKKFILIYIYIYWCINSAFFYLLYIIIFYLGYSPNHWRTIWSGWCPKCINYSRVYIPPSNLEQGRQDSTFRHRLYHW